MISSIDHRCFPTTVWAGHVKLGADALSQRPHGERLPDQEWINIPAPAVRGLCTLAESQSIGPNQIHNGIIRMFGAPPDAIAEMCANVIHLDLTSFPRLHWEDIRTAQFRGLNLKVILTAEKLGRPANTIQNAHPDAELILKKWNWLTLKGSLLC